MSTKVQLVSRTAKQNVFFLNSIVTSGTYGATLALSNLSIVDANGNSAFPFASVKFQGMRLPLSGGYVTNVAETAGVVTATEPTLALGSEYGFTIMQFNPYQGPGGSWVTHKVYASTPATGSAGNVGDIAKAWQSQIGMYKDLHVTMVVTGAALAITAAAGYPVITISNAQNGVTIATTTPYVVGIGNKADMTAFNSVTGQPYSNYSGYVSTNSYDICVMDYQTIDGEEFETVLFVNTGDANHANFITSLVTDIFKVGGLTYAEQAVAVN